MCVVVHSSSGAIICWIKKQELIYAQRYLRSEVEEIVFAHENVLKCLSKVLCIFDYISFFSINENCTLWKWVSCSIPSISFLFLSICCLPPISLHWTLNGFCKSMLNVESNLNEHEYTFYLCLICLIWSYQREKKIFSDVLWYAWDDGFRRGGGFR